MWHSKAERENRAIPFAVLGFRNNFCFVFTGGLDARLSAFSQRRSVDTQRMQSKTGKHKRGRAPNKSAVRLPKKQQPPGKPREGSNVIMLCRAER